MNQNKKIYFTAGIFGIITVSLVLFAIFPLFENIKENPGDLLSKRQSIASLEAENQNINIVNDKYQYYKQDLEKIYHLFVNSEVPIDFIRFLEKLAVDSNISIAISPAAGSRRGEDPWPSLYFQLALSGNFLNFSRFLEKLENSSQLIEIQNLNIRKTDKENMGQGDGGESIGADILIKVFTN